MGELHRVCKNFTRHDKKTRTILHPFGCLVSHVCERGILQRLHTRFPNVSIQTVEYDYDQSKTLRESRILLAIP